MAKAAVAKQLEIEVPNKVGMFAEVAAIIAGTGANMTSICAYSEEDKALFWIITSDNEKSKAALVKKGFKINEKEVVTVMLPDKVGQAQEIAEKIKKAGINLDYVYGTTCGCADSQALMIIGSAADKNKLAAAINA